MWGRRQQLKQGVSETPLLDALAVALASAADARGTERSSGQFGRSLGREPFGQPAVKANLRRFGAIFSAKTFAVTPKFLRPDVRRRGLDEQIGETVADEIVPAAVRTGVLPS